jgi:hypothetical protein
LALLLAPPLQATIAGSLRETVTAGAPAQERLIAKQNACP